MKILRLFFALSVTLLLRSSFLKALILKTVKEKRKKNKHLRNLEQ